MNFIIENGELLKYIEDTDYIRDVIIPDNVTSIKRNAFFNKKMHSVTIPDSVVKIGFGAFDSCKNLTEVSFSTKIQTIEEYAFNGTPWLAGKQNEAPLVIVNNLLINGEKCSGEIIIPDGVAEIAESAFFHCLSLTSVVIPDSVKKIGNRAFAECSELSSVILPHGITEICEESFMECVTLKRIEIPEGVKEIGECAFAGCGDLSYISFPKSLETVKQDAFSGTGWFSSEIDKSIFVHANSILLKNDYMTSLEGEIVIPNQITRLEDNVFQNCKKISSVILPDNIISIGKNAFYGCGLITEIDIPDSVIEIDDGAFRNCLGLKKLWIGKSVRHIGEAAFSNCTSLEIIEGGNSLEEIGECAFFDCISLKSIDISESLKTVGIAAFMNTPLLNQKDIKNAVVNDALIINDIKKENINHFESSQKSIVSSENGQMENLCFEQKKELALKTDNSEKLHLLIKNVDKRECYAIFRIAAENESCELSTALTIFGMVDGYEYLFDKDEDAEDDDEKEWLSFVKKLYNNIINGRYKEGKIYYKPMLNDNQLLLLKRTVCDEDYVFLIEHGNE